MGNCGFFGDLHVDWKMIKVNISNEIKNQQF